MGKVQHPFVWLSLQIRTPGSPDSNSWVHLLSCNLSLWISKAISLLKFCFVWSLSRVGYSCLRRDRVAVSGAWWCIEWMMIWDQWTTVRCQDAWFIFASTSEVEVRSEQFEPHLDSLAVTLTALTSKVDTCAKDFLLVILMVVETWILWLVSNSSSSKCQVRQTSPCGSYVMCVRAVRGPNIDAAKLETSWNFTHGDTWYAVERRRVVQSWRCVVWCSAPMGPWPGLWLTSSMTLWTRTLWTKFPWSGYGLTWSKRCPFDLPWPVTISYWSAVDLVHLISWWGRKTVHSFALSRDFDRHQVVTVQACQIRKHPLTPFLSKANIMLCFDAMYCRLFRLPAAQ